MKPTLRKLFPCACAFLCALFFHAHAHAQTPPPPGWNKLVYFIYQLEVTRYCGMTTGEAAAGFRARRDAVLARYPFTPQLVMSARTEADKLAHREWDNRGLGGFRRWCRQDAARYARTLSQAARAPDSFPFTSQNPTPP